jgi:hypothetical protein
MALTSEDLGMWLQLGGGYLVAGQRECRGRAGGPSRPGSLRALGQEVPSLALVERRHLAALIAQARW